MTLPDRPSTTRAQRDSTLTKLTVPSSRQKTPKQRSHVKKLTEAGKQELEKSLARERARQRAGLDD